MGRRVAYQSTFESVLAFIGLVLVVVLGAWWTGTAVAEGMVGATMLRFCLSVFGGCYYLVLYRIARYGAGRRTRRIS